MLGMHLRGMIDDDDLYQTPTTAVAVDKDKNSQQAVRWAIDHLASEDTIIALVHVKTSQAYQGYGYEEREGNRRPAMDHELAAFFRPFRLLFARKGVKVVDAVLENDDVPLAIVRYIQANHVRNVVVGAANKNAITRKFMSKHTDVPSRLLKVAPDFCSVYVIWKEKTLSVRSASKAHAPTSAMASPRHPLAPASPHHRSLRGSMDHDDSMFRREQAMLERMTQERSMEHERMLGPSLTWNNRYTYKHQGHPNSAPTPMQLQQSSDYPVHLPPRSSRSQPSSEELDRSDSRNNSFRSSSDLFDSSDSASFSIGSSMSSSTSSTSIAQDFCNRDLEAEMHRLKLELKHTMDMYNTACKEANLAKQKAEELHLWKIDEAREFEEVKGREEAAIAMAEMQKFQFKAAMEATQAAQKKAEQEMQKRRDAEREAEKKLMESSGCLDVAYRNYSIDEIEAATCKFSAHLKIGEGGYGPVFKGHLDHTPVAIKILRPDAAQGRKQFQQEVEVLSCIRHPNMVLLLGACSEYGCLVYEYMENGSLEDRLFCQNGTPPIPWTLRFKIAAEIATGLLFLHQTRPEPLVHRDLKPGNILLDRNYIAKISDVGLARLVPAKVADKVTQYRMTATAGTFCYIDPEYQMTGLLGIKSDVYSLGILLLQLITAKSPMGLALFVENAIDEGTFGRSLDPKVNDWPVEETMVFAKLALGCAEMRKKDRPDLGTAVLPELQRLAVLAQERGSL